jgi:hypothetical protein
MRYRKSLIAIAGVLTAVAARAEGMISVSPAVITRAVTAGEVATVEMVIENDTTSPMHFVAEADDVTVTAGERTIVRSGVLSGSIAEHVEFSLDRFDVLPGERKRVQVRFVVPARSSQRAFLAKFRANGEQFGTLVQLDARGRRSVASDGLNVLGDDSREGIRFVHTILNDGSEAAGTRGTAKLVDSSGVTVASKSYSPTRAIPGERQRLEAVIASNLPAGRYTAISSIESAGAEPRVESREITLR